MTVRGLLILALAAWCFSAAGCVTVLPPVPAAIVPQRAEISAIPSPLSVESAVAVALQNDPLLRATRRRVSVAYWRKVQRSLPPNPTLAASADPTEWVVKLTAELTSTFDIGGRRQHLVDAAQSREEQAAIQVVARGMDVMKEVRLAFAEISSTTVRENLTQQKMTLIADLHDRARRQQQAGELSDVALLAIEEKLQRTKADIADVTIERRRAEARLNRLLGRSPEAPISIVAFDGTDFLLVTHDSGDYLKLGLSRRPELLLLAARIREHQPLLALAEVSWIPRIEAGPLITKPGENEVITGGGAVSITLPIFDHGQARRAIQTSTIQSLEEELLAAEAQVILDVHLAVQDFRHARSRAQLRRELAKIAEQRHGIAQKAVILGVGSEATVLEQGIDHIDAMVLMAEAQRDIWIAEATLLAAVGDCDDTLWGEVR